MKYRNKQKIVKRYFKSVLTIIGVGILATTVTMASAQSDYDERDSYRSDQDRYEPRRVDDRRYQSENDRDRSEEDRYERRQERRRPSYSYCKDRARDITGYRGRTPDRYRKGSALEGAVKGGIDAGAKSWVTGGDKKQQRKARERGAKLGFLIGALKEGSEREKQRRNDERRRDYEFEVRNCMEDY